MGTRSRLLVAALSVVLAGSLALIGPASANKADPSKGKVGINTSPVAIVGTPMTFKGVVRPKRAGLKIGLQRKVGNSWKNVAQGKTAAGGRYTLRGSVEFGGIYQFRVIRLPWLTNSATSRVVTVDVYEWQRLDDADSYSVDGVSFDQPAAIGGVTYPNSVWMDADSQGSTQGGFFQLDLTGLNCAALVTQAGALEGGQTAANAKVGLLVKLDGTTLADKTYSLGDSEELVLDLRGGTTLRVESLVKQPGPTGKVALGSPKLLCAS